MSGISSGIGLISGIDTTALIEQLIALERRPIESLQSRVQEIDTRRAALLGISAKLLAIRNSASPFGNRDFFRAFSAKSSNENAVRVTATSEASPSTTTLRVRSLVTNHAVVSRGFADATSSPVGGGTISFEIGNGQVARGTSLDALNAGAGVQRGIITITDRTGNSAEIDLSEALTVSDVLEAINSERDIDVRARVTSLASNGATGDRIVLEDTSGGSGNLIVEDESGSRTALDLGIRADVAAGRIDGRDLIRLGLDTSLSQLNDGNGVDRLRRGNDLTFSTSEGSFDVSLSSLLDATTDVRTFNAGGGVHFGELRITDREGTAVEIDLSDLNEQTGVTAETVRSRIQAELDAAGSNASISIVNSGFVIGDSSEVPSQLPDGVDPPQLIVEDISGSAAADLGIEGSIPDGSLTGRAVYRMSTIGDVIRAINFASENSGGSVTVEAGLSADGNGITLRALGVPGEEVTVGAGENTGGSASGAAADLGILGATFSTYEPYESTPLVGGLNTVLLSTLRGGSGLDLGEVELTDRLGRRATVDLTSARTLQDVIDLINEDGSTGLRAEINGAGNGIALRDETGGSGVVSVSDVSGSAAAQLGIAGAHEDAGSDVIRGANLERQYVTRATLLEDFANGAGVSGGSIRVTDSTGQVRSIELPESLLTIGEVIDRINLVGLGERDSAEDDRFEARINDGGDGIVIIDRAGGDGLLSIEDEDGDRAATDLRIAGTAKAGANFIDGSLETRVKIAAGDTLRDVARKINESAAGVSAAVLNDGGAVNPFSLSITSETTGTRGEMLIDSAGINLGLSTLTRARDAVVTIGDSDSTNPILITSSTNSLENVLEGVSMDLLAVTDEDVTVNVAQDVDSIVASVSSFVDQFNGALDTIDDATDFNSETFERGPLFGDSTAATVQSRLYGLITRSFNTGDADFSRLFSVGLRLGEGNRLRFDEDEFREAYENDPAAVERLFTDEDNGFAAVVDSVLEGLSDDFDGLLATRQNTLEDQQELLNERIADLEILVEAKRARLEAQFVGLESSLAALQGQQSALASLAAAAG